MDYEAFLSDDAEETLLSFPYPWQEAIGEQIKKLEKNPARHSRKACFPYAPNGNVSLTSLIDADGEDHRFSIQFFFAPGEKRLNVFRIGHHIAAH